MLKITSLPMFGIGEVIDLSYKNGGMPNRIYINGVYWREQDTKWMYQVTMENTGDKSSMDEEFIKERRSRHTQPVYKNPDVIKRMSDGWRFCGNYDKETAIANAKLISQNDNVKAVRLYPAINYYNKFVNGQMGIWIMYKNMIYDNGQMAFGDNVNEFIDIK